MQVSGNIAVRSFQDVTSSQKISTLGTKSVSGFGASILENKKRKAKIKFKKIKGSDRLVAPHGLQDEYYSEEQEGFFDNVKRYFNLMKDSQPSGHSNFFLSGVLDDEGASPLKYFATTYLITEVEAPVPYVGSGTEAVQGVVEKSVVDEETCGRVILYLSQISPEDTSCKFFYKLGFRYADENLNELVNDSIEKNIPRIVVPSAYMYLPKDNVPKLLRYGHLF